MEGDGAQAEQAQVASDIGRRLSEGRHNKDSLVKLLKQAVNSLSKLRQSTSLKEALAPLNDSLSQGNVLHHKDKDVRLLVTVCLTEIIRILAPETPFSDKVFKDVFKLIVNNFSDLADVSSPYFTRRVKILQTVAAVKCCVLMLDLGCDNLVVEMFNIFFSVIRDDHQPSFCAALSIMTQILEENVSAFVVDIILRNLLKDKKKDSSAKLAGAVIENSTEKLGPFICGYLSSCILERDITDFELKEFYHEIIYSIFQYAPQMLSSVIPKLALELVTDQVDVRMKAVQLVGKLFAQSELHAAVDYRQLFVEFLKRFSDKSTEVRMRAIECAQACYISNSSSTAAVEILNALEERLLDTDEKVRTQSVSLVCDLATCNLSSFPLSMVLHATDRLRDKKVTVRRKAMQKLLELFRAYCQKCSECLMPFTDDFEQIPARILTLCFDKDCKEFRPESMEIVLAEDLFPVNLSVDERVNHWIAFFSLFSEHQKRALTSILSQKHRLQVEMQGYLSLREKDKEGYSEETQQEISSSLMKMALSFSDISRAEDCFKKLHQMKDDYIFEMLRDLIEGRMTFSGFISTQGAFLKRIGDQHPNLEFIRVLLVKCSHSIFTPEHVQCLLKVFFSRQSCGDKQLQCISDLLSIIVSVFPALVRGSERSFFQLFAENSNFPREKLLLLFGRVIHHVSVKLSDVSPLLEQICLQGTRSQSKAAIFAIAALNDADHSVFSVLSQKLLGFLRHSQNLPTVLQSLGCIASHLSSASCLLEQIIESIFEKIFLLPKCETSDLNKSTNIFSTSSIDLKVYGLRALVKLFLSPTVANAKHRIKDFLDILLVILKEDDQEGSDRSDDDLVLLRLAAAKAVVHLSSKWDLYISPQLFHLTMSFTRAPSTNAAKFLYKVWRLLSQRAIPNRYACAFAIAASYGQQDIQLESEKYLVKFIEECGCLTQNKMNSGDEGAIMSHPEYLVVFLIHVLANDQSFPSLECEDEKVYARSCWPLINFLQRVLGFLGDGCIGNVIDMASNLLGIFRAIKKANDAVNPLNTSKSHILSQIGALTIKHLCRDLPALNVPRVIFLPSSFYTANIDFKTRESDFLRKDIFSLGFIERTLGTRSSDQVSISDHGHVESNADPHLLYANRNIEKSFVTEKLDSFDGSEEILEEGNGHDSGVGFQDRSMQSNRICPNCSRVSSYPQSVELGNHPCRIRKCNDGEPKEVELNIEGEVLCSCHSGSMKFKLFSSPVSINENKESFASDKITGHQIKFQSALDRSFYSATVDANDSGSTAGKVTCDGENVELPSLERERHEIIGKIATKMDGNVPYCLHGEKLLSKENFSGNPNSSKNRSSQVRREERSKRMKLSSTSTEVVSRVGTEEKSVNESLRAEKGRALRTRRR